MKEPAPAKNREEMLLIAGPPRQQQSALVYFPDLRRAIAPRREQRGTDSDQQLQFFLVTPRGFGECAAKDHRAPDKILGLGICETLLGDLRGGTKMPDRFFRHPRRFI